MALQKQNVPISFSQGMDTKTDRKQVIAGKLIRLENGVFRKKDEIRKRYGYVGLATDVEGSSTGLSAGAGAMTFKNELLQFNGTGLYSYSDSVSRWSAKGTATSVSFSAFPVIRNTYQQTSCDSAFHSVGLYVSAWKDSRGGARYSVIDSATNQSIVADSLIDANASSPRVVALGSYILIFYYNTSSHKIFFKYISASTPSVISSAVEAATNVHTTNTRYDVVVIGTRAFLSYNSNDVGNSVCTLYVNSFLVVSSTNTVATESASGCIAVFGDATRQRVWVAYYNATKIRYFVLDYDLSSTPVLVATDVVTVGTINTITGYADAGSGTIFYQVNAAATYNNYVRSVSVTDAGVAGTAADLLRSVGLASKPFRYNSVTYLFVTQDSTLQPTYFLITSAGTIIGKLAPSVGGGLYTDKFLPTVSTVDTGIFSLSYLQKDLLTTVSGAIYTQTGVQTALIDFTSKYTYLRAELANNLHVIGGMLSMYDGAQFVEHGFHLYPENLSVATSTSGGSIADGTYQYVAVFEWTDNQGQVHRSAPSIPVSKTTTGGNTSTNTVTIPTLRVTGKRNTSSPVQVVVYRTKNGLTTFYQITSPTSPLYNDPTADTVSFADTYADATIAGNPLLYTTGGVLENIAPPAPRAICAYKNRLVVIPSENPYSYLYSKQYVPGTPIEFSDFLIANVSQKGGELTTGIEMDDKLILFKPASIFWTSWDGPDNAGTQNDVVDPVQIPADGGTINPRSVVLTPMGVMYQSKQGIYLLSRSLQVSYVGDAVEDFNDEEITSATMIPNSNEVRFTTESGTALVYDYFFQQWSIFTNHYAVDATVFQSSFTYLTSAGEMMQEDPTVFTDAGSFIRLKLVTSWLQFAGLQGFQRVYHALLLGEYQSPHQLLVQAAYDFNPAFIQNSYVDATALLDTPDYGEDDEFGDTSPYGGDYPLYEFRFNFARQKCTAVQLSIEDVQTSDLGEGFAISALTFRAGLKAGTNKLGKARVKA